MRKRHFLLAAGIALSLGSVFAGALGTPTGKVVLTITGKIGQTNSPQGAQFDMVMLEKLPQHYLLEMQVFHYFLLHQHLSTLHS